MAKGDKIAFICQNANVVTMLYKILLGEDSADGGIITLQDTARKNKKEGMLKFLLSISIVNSKAVCLVSPIIIF